MEDMNTRQTNVTFHNDNASISSFLFNEHFVTFDDQLNQLMSGWLCARKIHKQTKLLFSDRFVAHPPSPPAPLTPIFLPLYFAVVNTSFMDTKIDLLMFLFFMLFLSNCARKFRHCSICRRCLKKYDKVPFTLKQKVVDRI